MLENVPSSSSSSTEPLLFSADDEEAQNHHPQLRLKNKRYKNYATKSSKISFISKMWRQKKIIFVKVFKIFILLGIFGWIFFTYRHFIKSYYFIKDYDDFSPSSSSSSSSMYDSIYGPISSYMEWEEDVTEDKIDKFQIQFKDLNVSYYFYRDESLQCNDTKLLIVIPTRPNAFHTRMAIRKSWLKNVTSTVTYRFIIGSTSNLTIRHLNHEEFEQYNDLIISNIRDTYLNLTLKTFAILQWQQYYCPKTEFVLKTDDDTVVEVSRLQYWIENDFKNVSQNLDEKVIFGKVWSKTPPRRNPKNKWYTPFQAWNRKYFPDYCNGPTYLLTSKSVELILNQSINQYLITIEDVLFTGILAEAAGIKRIDRWKIFGRGKTINSKQGCDERNVPYLTSVYEIGDENLVFVEGKTNAFSQAKKRISALKCSKLFL